MVNELRISLDKDGNQIIDTIQWNEEFIATMVDGSKFSMINIAKSDSNVETSFYLLNTTPNRFGIKELKFPDDRVKIGFSSVWVLPFSSVKITMRFKVPSYPTKIDIIKSSELIINGFFIIEGT
jgi:hypothetical protein